MRIGIDARMYSAGFTGIGRYVYELIHHLLLIDEKNEYVLFFNEPEYSRFSPANVRLKKCLVNARHYSWKEQSIFLSILLREKLDLMHFTHFNAPLLYNSPFVVTIHDLTLSFFPGKKMTSFFHRLGYHAVLKNALKKAKAIIAVSKNTKKDIQMLFHVPDEKIHVIYEAAASEFKNISDNQGAGGRNSKFKIQNSKFIMKGRGLEVKAVRDTFNLDKPFLLYTGVWRNHKNLVNLINAFSILKNNYHFDGYLVITGKEDPYYPEVKESVKSLGLEKYVRFTGLVQDNELVCLYNLARVYVFPSLYEGFGLPILEAFQCGLPVCCSNASSLPEICGKGNALLFNPQDPLDMAQKINTVLTDENFRKELIERGQNRAKDFSWEKMAKHTMEIYDSLNSKFKIQNSK